VRDPTPYTAGLPRWARDELATIYTRPTTPALRAAALKVLHRHDALDLAPALGVAPDPRPAGGCALSGCDRPARVRDMCHTHYSANWRAGKRESGPASHGPNGYNCGCRCSVCRSARRGR